MIVEYSDSSLSNDKDGWEERYLNSYGDLYEFRLKVLMQDSSIDKVLKKIYIIINNLKKQNKSISILDVGCGTGHQLMQIAHLCDEAIGFDISQEIVENNNTINTSAKFISGDALNYPRFEQKFNMILMAGVLYSISEDRNIHKKIFSEAYSYLEKDGYFIFYHRGYLNLITRLRLLADKIINKIKNRKPTQYYMCWFDDKYVINLLEEQGFTIETIEKDDFAFPLTFGIPNKIFGKKNVEAYVSEDRLNFFGKFINFLSKNFFPKLSARTSIFIVRK